MNDSILTVAIATTERRLAGLNLEALPVQKGAVYRIFVQGSENLPLPVPLSRSDISFERTEGQGAARNRNAALRAVATPLLLFADDDLTFRPEGLTALIARFAAEPDASFLCGRLSDETGRLRKRYSPDGQAVHWWNCGKVGTPELALRPEAFRTRGLAFDTRFGAGMPDHLGDEYIFLCDTLRAGLRGRHVAVVLASHPTESSGTRNDPDLMEIRKRALIRALGPLNSRPALLAFALRHRVHFASWRAVWRFCM